jgi:hypothetical protein
MNNNEGAGMSARITDEQIQQLAGTARPYSLIVLQWGPHRRQEGAAEIELEHQRRMVSLRADGIIAVLCPVPSDTVCGVAIMNLPSAEATTVMDADPCVKAAMMTCQVYPCLGFPGDRLPA